MIELAKKLRSLYIKGMKEKYGFYIYPSSLDDKDKNLKYFLQLAEKVKERDINPSTLVRAYFYFRNGGVEDFCNYAVDAYEYYKDNFETESNMITTFIYFSKLVERYGMDYILDNLDKFPYSIRKLLRKLSKEEGK